MRKAGIILALILSLGSCGLSGDEISLASLSVEYGTTPLGLDEPEPRFSWQMKVEGERRSCFQTAYRITVRDPEGRKVWDTDRTPGSASLSHRYAGTQLQPCTRYTWAVQVWDQDNLSHEASSWFETGLLDPDKDLSAWDGARWIGGGDGDLVFYAPYQLIYKLKYALRIEEGSSRVGLVFGANDSRLMDENLNIHQLVNGKDDSYVKLEMDISGLQDGLGPARLNIFRSGYAPGDQADVPLASFHIKASLMNSGNMHDKHRMEVSSAFGRLVIVLDGNPDFFVPGPGYKPEIIPFEPEPWEGASLNVNPHGLGGDYLPYGMVCEIGFSMDAGQKASVSGLEIQNLRSPGNTLFQEDMNSDYQGIFADRVEVQDAAYQLDGGEEGLFIVADPSRNSTPMLRTEFMAGKRLRQARLYVTARGIYEFYINGRRVGDDYYNPGLTQYNKTHMYQTYDVSGLIDEGSNAMGAFLAEGWWSGLLSFVPIWNHFGDRQSLLAKLVLQYEDGSRQVVVSNEDWKYFGEGPLLYSSLDMGEVYDARREAQVEGWSEAGYDDGSWKQAAEVPLEGTSYEGSEYYFDGSLEPFHFRDMQLVGQIGNNAGIYQVLQARSVEKVRDGVFVYDMGQNFVGVPRLSFAGGTEGDSIQIRVSEMLYPDLPESGGNVGMVMIENYRAALCADLYVMKQGPQVFQPRFTSRGYRYLELTGLEEALPLDAVQGLAISSILELSADYRTSNERVNQLWSNLVWSNVDNFLSIPADCPQRNERMGWSGDISVFTRTATYVSQAQAFLRRHMRAMRDMQQANGRFTDVAPVGGGFGGILWGSAGITVPWEVYQQYGDRGLLEEHYDAMVAYVEYMESTLDPEMGFSMDAILGDWLSPQNMQTGTAFLSTVYHVYDLEIMVRVAELLGREEDAARFSRMYSERKAYFNDTYVSADSLSMAWTGGPWEFFSPPDAQAEFKVADTQSSYAVGLALGAFKEEFRDRMARCLAESVRRENPDDEGISRPGYSLMTGFIGTAWISKALSDHGYVEEAYRLLQNGNYPSWLYSVDQGATTIWERLNGYTVENGFGGNNRMNSFNHYSFGAVGQWMMAHSLGIERDEPGFQSFILRPEIDPTGEMRWAEGWYNSMYGRIFSRWEQGEGYLRYEASVPPNTTATLYLPAPLPEDVKGGGQPTWEADGISQARHEDGMAIFTLQSGNYHFECKTSQNTHR